jgi:hypothetical protein
MSPLFAPSPMLLAFLLLKTTLYLPAVAVLALIRVLGARGAARGLAGLALGIAALGIAARFGPPLMGLSGGALAQAAYIVANAGGGMVIALTASVPLALSGMVPGRRWWGIDAAHGLLLAGLFLLWWLAQ